jgi:beta-lactamase regulating signal transducer with metallopeptidase domain/protocatechuate 3,4-dioxygenase beta subunit
MTGYFLELFARSPREMMAVDLVAKVTIVLATAGAIALALRRSSAASRHLAWGLGLGAALVLPVFSFCLPGWYCPVISVSGESVRIPQSSSDSPALARMAASSASGSLGAMDREVEPLVDADSSSKLPSALIASSPSQPPVRSPSFVTPSWSWLWALWLAGAGVVISGPIAGRIALSRWERKAEPIVDDGWTALLTQVSSQLGQSRRVVLLRGDRAVMPMTWGLIRPVIVLPADAESWDNERRRGVLLHELAHVRRLDCLTQMIGRAACAVWWFHPLAWIAERQMRIERERACDDIVLLAGARASDYADHLLEIARNLRSGHAATLGGLAMARPSQLEARLRAILDPVRCRRGPSRGVAAVAFFAALFSLVSVATVRLSARANTAAAIAVVAQVADEPAGANRPARKVVLPMTLTGRVLDPTGKPVPGAAVMAIVRSKYSKRPLMEQSVLGALTAHEGRSDGSGRFRIEMPRTSSARQYGLVVTAMAPGFGVGWTDVDPDADPRVADVRLRTELIVEGTISDVKGAPAKGVALQIDSLFPVVGGAVSTVISRPDLTELKRRGLPAWPSTALSDEQGRFTLRGLSRDLLCRLLVEDPRFTLPFTVIQTADKVQSLRPFSPSAMIKVDAGAAPKPIAIRLQTAQTIIGRVTYADTGKPVAHALVASGEFYSEADADGRFRVVSTIPPRANRFGIRAESPEGAPYLMTSKQGEWPRGGVEQRIDIALARGMVVRGKITEAGTGRPVEGAVVRVTPYRNPGARTSEFSIPAATGADGTYRVAAPAGPGYVVVQGPDDDYVLKEFGAEGGMYFAQPGRRRFFAHAYIAVDLKPGGPEQEVNLTLKRGIELRGRVAGPDGQLVRNASVVSPLMLRTQPDGGWKLWLVPRDHSRIPAREGRFMLHGLDPDDAVEAFPIFLFDPDRKLGRVARLSGRAVADANGMIDFRLEPCGTARARLVTPDAKPLGNYPARSLVTLVVIPGPLLGDEAKQGPLFGQQAALAYLDPVNLGNDFQSDAEGRLTLPALIPGATYRIEDGTPTFDGGEPVIRKEFTAKPGEAIDLGDIVIARPRGRN